MLNNRSLFVSLFAFLSLTVLAEGGGAVEDQVKELQKQNAILKAQLANLKIKAETEKIQSEMLLVNRQTAPKTQSQSPYVSRPILLATEGFAGRMSGTFSMDGSIADFREGDTLPNGWRIDRIRKGEAFLSQKKDRLRLIVTTGNQTMATQAGGVPPQLGPGVLPLPPALPGSTNIPVQP